MQVYEELIRAWGRLSGVAVTFGSHQTCCFVFPPHQLAIHIDLDKTGERLCLGCSLGVVPPGAYRTLLFTAALKANAAQTEPRGIIAFSTKLNALLLFFYLPLHTTHAEKLQERLTLFRDYAEIWSQAIQREEIPVLTPSETSGSGMFGLGKK